jgi:hypothetical protein
MRSSMDICHIKFIRQLPSILYMGHLRITLLEKNITYPE